MDTLLKELLNSNLVFVLAGALGGLAGLLLSYKEMGKIIRMIRTSTAEIGSLPADEQVQIVGQADGDTILSSPITRTNCVLWQVTVSERRSSGKSSHWVKIYNNTSTSPFDVYDATGRMRLYPGRSLELLLKDDVHKSSGVFYSLDEQTQAALKQLGVDTKGFLNMNRPLRVQERYLEKGDEIYVLGKTVSKNGAKLMDSESALIVSDQSELRLVGKFLWQIFVNTLIGVVFGVGLGLYFMNR